MSRVYAGNTSPDTPYVTLPPVSGRPAAGAKESTMTQPFGLPEPDPRFDHTLQQPPILEERLRAIEAYVIVMSRRLTKLDAYITALATRLDRLEAKAAPSERQDHRMPRDLRETKRT